MKVAPTGASWTLPTVGLALFLGRAVPAGRVGGCCTSLTAASYARGIYQLRSCLRDTLRPPSGGRAAAERQGQLRVALTDRFLRRSCALPALLTFGKPDETGGLLVALRQAMFVPAVTAAGAGPSGSRAPPPPVGASCRELRVRTPLLVPY